MNFWNVLIINSTATNLWALTAFYFFRQSTIIPILQTTRFKSVSIFMSQKKNLTMKIIFQMNSLALQDKNIYSLLGVCFPCGSAGTEFTCSAGDLGLIPGLGRSPGEGKGYPLQCSGLENSMVRGVTKSQTRLSNFHSLYWESTMHRLCSEEFKNRVQFNPQKNSKGRCFIPVADEEKEV